MDKTYIEVKGRWIYFYWPVEKFETEEQGKRHVLAFPNFWPALDF
jgi:hypothetical protein